MLSPCETTHLTCISEGSIALASNRLSGTLPAELFQLVRLGKL